MPALTWSKFAMIQIQSIVRVVQTVNRNAAMTSKVPTIIACIALAYALAVSVCQRSDYVRLQKMGAPAAHWEEIFLGHEPDE